jgi:hypothetical protein
VEPPLVNKNQLHDLIRDDRQGMIREMIDADRKARQDAYRQTNPLAPPGDPDGAEWRGQWHTMIMLCRLAYEALEDDSADDAVRAYPEPFESLRRHLIGVRKLLKAAADDERTIRAVRQQLLAVSDQRDQAIDIAEEAVTSLNRLVRDETSPIAAALDELRREVTRLKRNLMPDEP